VSRLGPSRARNWPAVASLRPLDLDSVQVSAGQPMSVQSSSRGTWCSIISSSRLASSVRDSAADLVDFFSLRALRSIAP
jgi:hypothetical protein